MGQQALSPKVGIGQQRAFSYPGFRRLAGCVIFAWAVVFGSAWADLASGSDCSIGLPPLPAAMQAAEPESIRLGERLFHDARLSADGSTACSSCHRSDRAFSDGLPKAKGLGGATGNRNTPSLFNLAYVSAFSWDGRRSDLKQQALDPLLNPMEHGLSDLTDLQSLVQDDPDYRELLRRLAPQSADASPVAIAADALALYLRTLRSGGSAFDRFFFAGEEDALSQRARRGWGLFSGRAGCVQCHPVGKDWALFTDYQFRSTGITAPTPNAKLARLTRRVKEIPPETLATEITKDAELAALGRFLVTRNPKDIAKFRTPSLRDVARTAPYMHDGSVATLEQAVEKELYYLRTQGPRPVILTYEERLSLVAFLESLSGCRP